MKITPRKASIIPMKTESMMDEDMKKETMEKDAMKKDGMSEGDKTSM